MEQGVQVKEHVGETPYLDLCALAEIKPFSQTIEISNFNQIEKLSNAPLNERLTAALQVILELATESQIQNEKIDKVFLDGLIAKIDQLIAEQLDEIIHQKEFQKVESLWRSLSYLVEQTDFRANTKIELLDISKEDLIEDFEDSSEVMQSVLYKHIYVDEYDTPGGEPFTAIVSPYEFKSNAVDISLLRNIAKVSASAHCPFLGNVSAAFFGKNSIEDVIHIQDLESYMEKAEFIKWNSFRQTEDARYIGLTMPKFLLRLPYGEDNPSVGFKYQEDTICCEGEKYLWGCASFALAANMTKSFRDNGWCVNIRGPEGGGKVENLPLHQYNIGQGLQTKIPSEAMLSETKELEISSLGFIPLTYYKNSNFACFFSANSAQKPKYYSADINANANSRINSRLPYVFLSARIAHYLKVIQREMIGSTKSRTDLEDELNRWISTLVTKMNNPAPELASSHPLKEASISVFDIPENPGYYKVNMLAVPHFQIEGMDIQLALTAKLPSGETESKE